MRATLTATLLALLPLMAACKQTIERPTDFGPLTFDVRVSSGPTGTVDNPLPFAATMTFVLDIQAIGHDGLPTTEFNSDVHLDVNPVGDLPDGQAEWVTVTSGVARNVAVDVEGIHGMGQIWVEDIGTDDAPGSYATGLSPEIAVAHPTIRQLQETDQHESNALEGDFVQLSIDQRDVVVTGVTNDGFYATDKAEAVWGGLFVFTHSRPQGLEAGSRLAALSGTSEEFFGFTELSFPSWKSAGTSAIPPPVLLSTPIVADNLMMEQYEGGLVEVQGGVVCPPGEDFFLFGQWRLLLDPMGDCDSGTGAVTVLSAFTVDWFDPMENDGRQLSRVTGNLRFHSSAQPQWIVRPRDGDDMQL